MLFHRLTLRRSRSHWGFTLIEMAIVLGIVGVLAGGLWRLMSTGAQQTKDQTTAQQHLALISAVSGYLADTGAYGGQALLKNLGSSGTTNIPLPVSNASITNCQTVGYVASGGVASPYANFCNYLPTGFSSATTNPYGQTYTIQALKDANGPGVAPTTYSFMIIASGAVVPDTNGGRISSLIGGDGGFIYTSSVCGAVPNVCGTMGAWTINAVTTYGFGAATAVAGSVASRTFIGANANGSNFWLARQVINGDNLAAYSYNTMNTHLFMNPGYDLYMYPDNNTNSPPLPTAGAGTNNIHLYDGALLIEGSNANGSIQLESVGTITGVGSVTSGPQISLTGNSTFMTASNNTPLIALTSGGCTQLNSPYNIPIGQAGYVPCSPVISATTGDITIANGELLATKILSTSDVRLKTNIRPIEDPLASLMKIEAVAYALKNGGAESMGVTAQNLEKTYPQLVSESGGKKYVDYNGLIGPLIGAVQELKRQNDDLREQLQQQKLREDRLENTLKQKSVAP